ncbi:MAG: PIG-L deacetylase family protein [Candidatus Glassbacteria bacterium]
MIFKKVTKIFRKPVYPRIVLPHELGISLVISPHPDDDAIGLGGTIHSIHDRVWIVHVTDGKLGIPGRKPENAKKVRVEEAIQSATILGVDTDRLKFLGFPDQKTGKIDTISDRLSALVKEVLPQDIFVPSPLDAHPDHKNIAQATSRALEEVKYTYTCWVYEVWTPIYPNSIIDISRVADIKRKAIRAHRSQVAIIDYVEKVMGLNSFRSITQTGIRYAEAFIRCTSGEYKEFTHSISQ